MSENKWDTSVSMKFNAGLGLKTTWPAVAGRISVHRYEGEFATPALQARADTGLFYAHLLGSHVKIQGEGDTQDDAVQDLKHRLEEEAAHCYRMASVCPGHRRDVMTGVVSEASDVVQGAYHALSVIAAGSMARLAEEDQVMVTKALRDLKPLMKNLGGLHRDA